jgi:antitoxin HicB
LPGATVPKCDSNGQLAAVRATETGLDRRLWIPDTEARRLLDLDHPTKMDRLERGLASFGVELVVTTRKPAA